MPVVVAWIAEALLTTIGQLAISALVSLGIGFVGSKAFSGVIDATGIRSMLAGAGPLLDYFGWMGGDVAITIVLSAWAGRMVTSALRVHLASKRTP